MPNLTIESLITAPLVAVSKANVVMTSGQTRALLDTCFVKRDNEHYEPVMVSMSLTRGFLPADTTAADTAMVKPVSVQFAVPLLCLIPINNIAVEKVNLEFHMDVTGTAPKPQKALVGGVNPVIDNKAVLLAKISRAPDAAGARASEQSSHLKVNISAGPLPLPPGLLAVLDLYTKAIHPAGLTAPKA